MTEVCTYVYDWYGCYNSITNSLRFFDEHMMLGLVLL